jgi:hypothetical protein
MQNTRCGIENAIYKCKVKRHLTSKRVKGLARQASKRKHIII